MHPTMVLGRRDPKRYYEILNLQPGASRSEVRLAYTFLRNASRSNPRLPLARIQEAYDFLSNQGHKAGYDAPPSSRRGPSYRAVGLAVVVALTAFGGLVFPGFLRLPPYPFVAGAHLVTRADEAPLGEVVRAEELHAFPNGFRDRAYLVKLPDGRERWFPASDLERHYRRR